MNHDRWIAALSPNTWSLRRRMLVSISAFSILLFILLGVAAYKVALSETEEILDRQMSEMAYFLAKSPIDDLDSIFSPHYRYNETDVFIDVWKYQPSPNERNELHTKLDQIIVPRVAQAQFLQKKTPRGELIIFVLPLHDKQIQISQLMSVRRQLATELALNMLLPYMILMPLALFGLAWLIRKSMQPLIDLKNMISLRSHQDLQPIHLPITPSEISPLVSELNWLFQRIADSQQQQQQFIADAAHELRTPLTALNMQLAVLERVQTGQEQQPYNLDNLKKGLVRIQHLVTQMMALAHQDASHRDEVVSVDLFEQTRFVLAQLMLSARKKNIDLGVALSEPQPIFIRASLGSIQSIISNIIDNAIKYTPAHGAIDICVKHDDQYAYLVVDDSGPGVPAAQYQNILERFFRLPNTQHQVMGSGLGLSIVQSALLQLGGQIHFARAEKLGGLSVMIQLPLA